MAEQRDLSFGRQSYEVLQKNSQGKYAITPFSTALASGGEKPIQPLTKMRMLQDLGWPQAKREFRDTQGHPRIVKKDDLIWLLKCKPSCWRLYFYVNQKGKQIIYVHAVCKKQDKEDEADAREARRVADEIRPGGSAITPFDFPPG